VLQVAHETPVQRSSGAPARLTGRNVDRVRVRPEAIVEGDSFDGIETHVLPGDSAVIALT
jgi:hypothetical protein